MAERRWRTDATRKWLRELTGIVLGVLIALALGEAADAVRWRMRVAQAKAAMRQESSGNRFNVVERRLYTPCVARRLVEIDAILRSAWRTGRLPPLGMVGMPGSRIVETAAYDVATSEGTPMHMDRGDARDIAIAYGLGARDWPNAVAAERDLWATLSMLQQPGGPVDSNVLAMLTEARARAARAAEDVALLSRQVDEEYAKRGVPIEWGRYGDLAGLTRYVRARPLCRPLSSG